MTDDDIEAGAEHDVPGPETGFDPAFLDGHTLEELSDYLDAGRRPRNASIEESSGAQLALESMARLRRLAPQLLPRDALADEEEGWLRRLLDRITADTRSGRAIAVAVPGLADAELAVTEGAIRGLVRATERSVPGALIGRCRVGGDLRDPLAPISVDIDVSAAYGMPIVDLAERLRAAIVRRVHEHTARPVAAVDITVHDIRLLPPADIR